MRLRRNSDLGSSPEIGRRIQSRRFQEIGAGTGELVGAKSVSRAARVMIADTDHSHSAIS
jgi:predicted RNA methylase